MATLYCIGIPLGSWFVLNKKKSSIQKLQTIAKSLRDLTNNSAVNRYEGMALNLRRKSAIQKVLLDGAVASSGRGNEQIRDHLEKTGADMQQQDPWLVGISPLFKDYDAAYWWFELPKSLVTLIMCGLITLIPAEGSSQVFVSLVVSTGMMLLFANCHPYLNFTDDILAQFCQLVLTFALAVGILEMASESFQDPLYGPLLVVATTTNLVFGVVIIGTDFFVSAMPERSEAIARRVMMNTTNKKRNATVVPTAFPSSENMDKAQLVEVSAPSLVAEDCDLIEQRSGCEPALLKGPKIVKRISKAHKSPALDMNLESVRRGSLVLSSDL